MAEIIPSHIPAGASRGEIHTFELLKNLPDDYLVYYEPNIKNRRPDFIVIAPDLGVIIIEVKGWSYDQIQTVNDKEISLIRDNREVFEIHPLEQARKYQWRLYDACINNPKRSLLFNDNGIHKNKFSFPFCHFVILSNISRKQIERREEPNLYEIFRPENTLYRDQMLALKDASPEKLKRIFQGFFDPWWPITPFTDDQVDVLRSVIHPEIILSPLRSRSINSSEIVQSQELVILDRKQENNARRIGEGHRVIYGVAGSGKTVILVARSKWLHDENPAAKILLVCYNVTLSVYLKQVLKNYPRIQVFHFDGWAKHNGIQPRHKDPKTGDLEDDISLGTRLLEHLRNEYGDYRRYDAVLIDEAQDFPPIWFTCILESMADPIDGDLLIVCDGNQGIRLIDAISWKSIGIKARGRTIHSAFDLDRNYRNTKEILKLASHFTTKIVGNNEDIMSTIPVDPSQAIRTGPKPLLFSCENHSKECEKIVEIVQKFLEGNVVHNNVPIKLQPEEIGILYFKKPVKDAETFKKFLTDLGTHARVTWLSEDYYSRRKVFDKSIKVQTVASSKGLEYRAVILMWTGLFDAENWADVDQQQRFLYVAMTRAQEVLMITYSKETEFIEWMKTSGDAETR